MSIRLDDVIIRQLEVKNEGKFVYSGIQEASTNSARPVWFSNNSGPSIPVYSDTFKYNPSTRSLELTPSANDARAYLKTTIGILNITSASTLYIDRGSACSLIFQLAGTENARFDTSGNFRPKEENLYSIGNSTYPWKNVYARQILSYAEGKTYAYLNATTLGTASDQGIARLSLGNNLAAGTEKNARGQILLYGQNTGYLIIYTNVGTGTPTLYLRDHGKTAYTVGTPNTSAVGGSTHPVYVDSSGIITACGSLWTNSDLNSTTEFQVGVTSAAGKIYLYSQETSTKNRGIYGSNSSGTQVSILVVDKDNNVSLNGSSTKLASGKTLKVSLGSTNASTAFDGTANVHDIGVSGILPATHGGTGLSALVTPTVTWTGGTTNGPTLKIKDSLGKQSSEVAIPKATGTASGIVTTGTQTFAGAKTFTGTPTFKNAHYYASCHFMPGLRASGEARTGVIYSFVGSSSSDTAISTNYFAFRQYSYTTGSTEVLSKFDQFALPTTVADKAANNYYSILTTKDKVTVAQGGTGLGTLTAGYALIGNGTSAVSLRPITNNTSVGASGWSGSVGTNLITHNTLAYWNGAYSGTTSNLSILGTVTTGVWHGSVIGVGYGGTGQTTAKNACNAFLNALDTGSSVPVDADYYISQYVGGGTTTTTYHRRPVSALYSYIKGKLDSVYAAASHSHSYLPLSGGTVTGTLILSRTTDTEATSSTKSALIVGGDGTGQHLALDGNEIMSKGSSTTSATLYLNNNGGGVVMGGSLTVNGTTASSSTSTGALIVKGGIGAAGNIYGAKVYGAVWNDYAEYRSQFENISAGRVAYCKNDGKLRITVERLQKFEGVVSDTFGFAIGETDNTKTPLAVSGRVLVYTYEPRDTFNSGDCVCAAPNGTVSKMTREEIITYPDRIVGVVSEIPNYETWGTGEVSVNGRVWIKVK